MDSSRSVRSHSKSMVDALIGAWVSYDLLPYEMGSDEEKDLHRNGAGQYQLDSKAARDLVSYWRILVGRGKKGLDGDSVDKWEKCIKAYFAAHEEEFTICE